jgi:two-component system nitrogen regulation sensor histidine kinase GlnL
MRVSQRESFTIADQKVAAIVFPHPLCCVTIRRVLRSGKRKARQTLQPGGLLLENVLASLEDAIVLFDEADCIIKCNQATEQMTGLAEAQLLGRSCEEVFGATPGIAAMVARTRQLGQSEACGEEALSVGRSRLPVRISSSPIFGNQGHVEGTALVVHDLSFQKKLEDEARRNETLARLGPLVAGLAHEIKNPLGGIKGAAQLLARRLQEDRDVLAYTDVMIREIDRLSNLVEQLLGLGAPRSPTLVAVNVHEILRDVLDLMKPELDAADVKLRIEIDPSLPDVFGDSPQLKQVFLNVIKNALEAMPPGGVLSLATRMETDFHIMRLRASQAASAAEGRPTRSHAKFLRLEIADDGPGFPADATRLFEPFFTTKARGTGLGLAICQGIVAGHDGDIRVSNRPEGGGQVTITLPLVTT